MAIQPSRFEGDSSMEFPLKSFGAFGAAFSAVSLLCDWLRAFVLGWYETKWTPELNFGIDVIAALILFVPAAMLGFAVGAYSVNAGRDPWGRSFVGGTVFAFVFFGVTRLSLHIDSTALVNALVWGTLLLGSASVGAWARFSVRRKP
jgi:hypothetical protein